MKRKFLTLGLAGIVLVSSLLTGCAGKDQNTAETEKTEMTENAGQSAEDQKQTGIAGESASDSQIDFTALQAENPDIFGWLYIPGTGIDDPILQSEEADDYYETRDAYGRELCWNEKKFAQIASEQQKNGEKGLQTVRKFYKINLYI